MYQLSFTGAQPFQWLQRYVSGFVRQRTYLITDLHPEI